MDAPSEQRKQMTNYKQISTASEAKTRQKNLAIAKANDLVPKTVWKCAKYQKMF